MNVTPDHIKKWHIEENGWSRVGYNVLVGREGKLDIMIPFDSNDFVSREELANGARGFNSTSLHGCWAGGKGDVDSRTPGQRTTMEAVTKMMVMIFPKIKIIGHNQVNAYKYCPAINLIKWLKDIGIEDKNIDYGNYEDNPHFAKYGW